MSLDGLNSLLDFGLQALACVKALVDIELDLVATLVNDVPVLPPLGRVHLLRVRTAIEFRHVYGLFLLNIFRRLVASISRRF